MTITDIRPHLTVEDTTTRESVHVAGLREQLKDPALAEHHADIRAAIDYLIGRTFVADLAA